jgi:hypothetical protein
MSDVLLMIERLQRLFIEEHQERPTHVLVGSNKYLKLKEQAAAVNYENIYDQRILGMTTVMASNPECLEVRGE